MKDSCTGSKLQEPHPCLHSQRQFPSEFLQPKYWFSQLIVYKDAQGHHFEAITPNSTVYHHSEIFYSASSAEVKGRRWIEELRLEF